LTIEPISTQSEQLPPPPPLPPLSFVNHTINEDNCIKENDKLEKKSRTPVPLPRVKMMQPGNMISNVQTFSINQCTQNFKFPKFTEETFFGSGENSDEESLEYYNERNEAPIDN
jgi:hypothetical protein